MMTKFNPKAWIKECKRIEEDEQKIRSILFDNYVRNRPQKPKVNFLIKQFRNIKYEIKNFFEWLNIKRY